MKPTYLIIGLTQQGKSSICKSIFKDEDILIGIGDSGNSVTTQPRAYQQIGIKIQLVDTVGLQDTNEFNAQTEGIITKSLNYCQKQKILSLRGIIITISFRQQEIKQISALLLNLQILFKLKNFDSLIFCLTKGNELNNQIRVHQIEFLKQVLANEFSISYERIIQYNTNYIEPSGKYIEFKNEKKRFLKNLQNLSNSMIKIEMNQQIIELQVKPLHAGGRHKILRSSGYFTFEDSMMLSKLYQISNLKICQESKGYQKTSEDIKKDNKKIFLKSSNLFKNNILFRHAIIEIEFPNIFPIGKFSSMLTDKFRREIVQFKFRNGIESQFRLQDSCIVQCLFLQNLLYNDNLDDLQLLEEEFESFKQKCHVLKEAKLYYEWITGKISRKEFYEKIGLIKLGIKQITKQIVNRDQREEWEWEQSESGEYRESGEQRESEYKQNLAQNSNLFQNNQSGNDQTLNFRLPIQYEAISEYFENGQQNGDLDQSFQQSWLENES